MSAGDLGGLRPARNCGLGLVVGEEDGPDSANHPHRLSCAPGPGGLGRRRSAMGRFYSCSVVDDPHLRPRGVTLRRSPDEWQFELPPVWRTGLVSG